MARVAFVMDKLLRKIGLSGRSIVPMLVGFGCTVPGVMASRTLPSERDRKMTILLTPFMSCSAKLPIYAFFTAAKIRIAKRGYGEKSQIPLSSILPRKSAFEKPENSPNSLPSASWCIKIGLQKRIWHACSPVDFIPPQSQWRCNCLLPRRSAAHLDAGERGLGGA